MKQIYTLIIALFIISTAAQARPVNVVTSWWGNWSAKGSWSLNRLPEDGDSIVIPEGKGIVLDKNYSLGSVYIKVMGTLQIKKKLSLDELSFIAVLEKGRINAFGADRKNETIKLGSKVKFNEKDVVEIAGVSYASKNTGTAPVGFVYDMTLPVKFVSFYATSQNNSVLLTWATTEEKDNSHFEIEKSVDGREWKTLGVVFGNGTSSLLNKYSYTDKSVKSATTYYRIRQVDVNGTAVYSAVKVISETKAASSVSIFASNGKNIVINMNSDARENMQVTVLNTNGQVVNRQTVANASYQVTVPMNTVPSGLYIVQVSDKSGWNEVKKVVL